MARRRLRVTTVLETVERAPIDYALWPTAGLVSQGGCIVLLLSNHRSAEDVLDTIVHEAVHLAYPDLQEPAVRAAVQRLLRNQRVALAAARRACAVLWDAYLELKRKVR